MFTSLAGRINVKLAGSLNDSRLILLSLLKFWKWTWILGCVLRLLLRIKSLLNYLNRILTFIWYNYLKKIKRTKALFSDLCVLFRDLSSKSDVLHLIAPIIIFSLLSLIEVQNYVIVFWKCRFVFILQPKTQNCTSVKESGVVLLR